MLLCCRRLRGELELGKRLQIQPTTAGAKVRTPLFDLVEASGPIAAQNNATAIGYLLHDSIPDILLLGLLRSTHTLCSVGPLKKKYSSTRGGGLTMRIGFWRRYSTVLYESADFRNKWSRWWASVNRPVWQHASDLLKQHFPSVHKILQRVHAPHKFGSWHMAVLNVNLAVSPHCDDWDHIEGICCVIVLGEFVGGELCFPDELVCVKVKHGTIVLFHSRKFRHVVSRFVGIRFSIVLHADEEVIKNHLW